MMEQRGNLREFTIKRRRVFFSMATRKYLTEFGLNMFGSYSALLQHDKIEELATDNTYAANPCHIYMITRRPRITLEPSSIKFDEEHVKGIFNIQRGANLEPYSFEIPNQLGTSNLKIDCPYPHTEFRIYNENNETVSFGKTALLISMIGKFWELLPLEVLYVGQAYGAEGTRSAPARLKNHSTLQRIYAEAIRKSPDQEIWLVLWSFEQVLLMGIDGTQQIYGTTDQEDKEHTHLVVRNNVTEQQRINFTEAALIRYFEPEYNKIYKGSFPNPDHKNYSECYDLDINFISVELQTRDLMCQLWSPKAPARWTHYATYLLHSIEERKAMFDFS